MTGLNLTTLHANMKTALQTQFPSCFVGYYTRPGDKLTTPALLIDLDEIETDGEGDIGTEQLPVILRMNIYCVLDYRDGNKLAVRVLAASVMQFIRQKRWSLEIGPCKPDGAMPDRFKKGNPPENANTEEYEVFRVDFHHEAVLGTDVWEFDGEFPTQVFAGIDPRIGEDYEADYLDVTEDRT